MTEPIKEEDPGFELQPRVQKGNSILTGTPKMFKCMQIERLKSLKGEYSFDLCWLLLLNIFRKDSDKRKSQKSACEKKGGT